MIVMSGKRPLARGSFSRIPCRSQASSRLRQSTVCRSSGGSSIAGLRLVTRRGRYALLERYLKAQPDPKHPTQLHNGDCNNTGGFSTDHIGANYAWPEADYATREKIFQDHVNYQQGLMWFSGNDPEVPEVIRAKTNAYGLLAG